MALSHTSVSQALGNLKEWKKDSFGISGETSHEKFRIQVYTDSIIRLSLTRSEEFDDLSYAVVAKPDAVNFTVHENETSLELQTSKTLLTIQKNPMRFRFATLDNKTISEDDHAFGTSWNGEQVTTYRKLQEGERFIGLGEKTGGLDRKGSGYQNWNTDSFGYGSGADPLYSSMPFFIGIHNELTYGIFFDNSHKSFFNFGASNNRFTSFSADQGEMNYYFIYDHSVSKIIQHYTHLTGRMEMPPLWSIGYQQCRYSYYPDKEVLTLAQTFRDKDIPSDVIVFDIHYMEKYKIFTWSEKDFPDPKGLLHKLKAMGFHVVVMCDPGIKVEDGYKAYDDGIKQDVFLKYPDGTNYTGQVWPGWCHFPDFTKPAARDWWREQFKEYVALGVEGYWNDMNEIATWGQMLPENIEFDFEGNKGSMRKGRNLFGFQMARSTYEGTKELLKGKRPFNLTRSGFSGVQRYAAVWTGDNVAYDEHMLLGVRMVNSMGLTGIAFAGYDVGGFVGNADSNLFARWISIGALSPFFRGHSMINSRDTEPWTYGEEVEQISRNYIKFRYKLLPYIYSLFHEASLNGMPVQRSLAIDYTHDSKIYEGQFSNQYLFGPSILVAPVESNKEFVKVYLPKGNWHYLYTGKKYEGNSEIIMECPLNRLPIFVKAGAILPMQPAKSHTKEISTTTILHLYSGGDASFTQYEDDGSTFDYQKGNFAKRSIENKNSEHKVVLSAVEGSFKSPSKKIKFVLHGREEHAESVVINGKVFKLSKEMNQFFAPMEKYDPFSDPDRGPEEPVHVVEVEYTSQEITLAW